MGSSTSKPASKVASSAASAARRYPNRPSAPSSATSTPSPQTNAPSRPPPPAQNSRPGPTVKPQARASGTRDEAINLDASDPDFARSLRSLGAVQPNPTYSNTSTFNSQPSVFPQSQQPNPRLNPALMVLEARSRLADEADQEFLNAGKRGDAGRRFLDVGTLRQIVTLRDERGASAAEIERQLGLKSGVVARLGPKGVVGVRGIIQKE